MYYSLTLLVLTCILLALAWRQRAVLIDRLPPSAQEHIPQWLHPSSALHGGSSAGGGSGRTGYARLPIFDWGTAHSAGLNSSLFDIEANIADGDSRTGLDQRGAEEVQAIMQSQGVSFDEARLIRHQQLLRANNIDPQTGLPLDSKAVLSLGPSRR